MANTETTQPEIRLLIDDFKPASSASWTNVSFRGRFVYVDPDDGHIKNPLGDGYSVNDWQTPMADLIISAQADVQDGQWYGFDVRYESPYSVDLHRAEVAVKTLRRVAKHLDRLQARYGSPQDLFGFVARVAEAFSVTSYGWRTSKHVGFSYSDNTYRWGDIDTLRYHVDQELVALKEGVRS